MSNPSRSEAGNTPELEGERTRKEGPLTVERLASITTAAQRQSAWRIGISLNRLHWSMGQSWITSRRGPKAVAAATFGQLIANARAIGADFRAGSLLHEVIASEQLHWQEDFIAYGHYEAIALMEEDLEYQNRMDPDPLEQLKRVACEALLSRVDATIETVSDAVHSLAAPVFKELVEFGRLVDRGLRPSGCIERMFYLADEGAGDGELDQIWKLTRSASRGRLLPSRTRPPQVSLDLDWIRNLRLIWRSHCVPDEWCPIGERHETGGVGIPARELVALVKAIMNRFLDAPQQPLLEGGTTTLQLGPIKLRRAPRSDGGLGRRVLASFEECRWPVYVDTPFPPSSVKTTQAVYQANQGLKYLRFASKKDHITWDWDLPISSINRP